MKVAKKTMVDKVVASRTICSDCDNARADRCEWIRTGDIDVEIKGWVTEEKIIPNKAQGDVITKCVLRCPNFVLAPNASKN